MREVRHFATVLALLFTLPWLSGFGHGEEERDRASATIKGIISDASTGEKLYPVHVQIMDSTRQLGTTNNQQGYFEINSLNQGNYTLKFSFLGYEPKEVSVSVRPGNTQEVDVAMHPAGYELSELTVSSQKVRPPSVDLGRRTIDRDYLNVPTMAQQDVFHAIQLLPGVKASSDFNSGLHIRGGSPDQTLVMLGDNIVYNPTHFYGFYSTFNPDIVRDLTLYKGVYPARYGGRLGSVIDIDHRSGSREQLSGGFSAGMLASRMSLEGPLPGGSFLVAMRRSTLEPMLDYLQSSTDHIPDHYHFYDVNARAVFSPSSSHSINLMYFEGRDKLSYPFRHQSSFDLSYGNRSFSAGWDWQQTRRWMTSLSATSTRYFNEPDFDMGGTPLMSRNRIDDHALKLDIRYRLGKHSSVQTGVKAGRLEVDFSDGWANGNVFTSSVQNDYLSAWFQSELELTRRWRVNSGVHFSYYSNGGYERWEPRFSTRYELHPRLALEAGYGRTHQFAMLSTNDTFSGNEVWLTTNSEISPARSDQIAMGLQWQLPAHFRFDVEGYYRIMQDLFELDPMIPDLSGYDYGDIFHQGEGFAYGAEVSLRRESGRLSGMIAYTYGVARQRFEEFNRGRFFPPDYDRTHDLNIVTRLRISDHWEGTAVFSYATGQPYTRPSGRHVIRQDYFARDLINLIDIDGINNARLPDYHRLDLGLIRRGTFFGMADAEWQLQVINAYSRRNVWFYRYEFGDEKVSRESVLLLPVLPSLSYTIQF